MTVTTNADSLVPLRTENVNRYTRNFLHQAVCELRFPTLLSLAGAQPPRGLVNALRKAYPTLERAQEVAIDLVGSGSEKSFSHVLRSAKGQWTVTLKPSALLIETPRYTGFVEFRRRVLEAVEAAREDLDTDFFTRVGLRYQNVVQPRGEALHHWVNPTLIGPLIKQGFTGVSEFAGKMLLNIPDDGGCLLQHGLKHRDSGRAGDSQPADYGSDYVPDYVIDIDTYRSTVTLVDVPEVLDRLHAQGFSVFDWSLGEQARIYLSGQDTKAKGD